MTKYSPADPSQKLLYNLQVLRAFAALIVVCVHIAPLLRVLGLQPFGAEGVSLFFVISGFIMVATTLQKRVSPGEFLLNRVLRIVPMYWLCTAAVVSIAMLRPGLLANTVVSPANIIRSLLFIPFAKSNGALEPILFVGWTLNYEMVFYTLFALSLFIGDARLRVLSLVFTLAVIVILGATLPGDRVWRFYTNQIILQFAAGMVLALLAPKLTRVVQSLPVFAVLTAGLAMAVLLTFNTYVFPPVISRTMAGVEATILVGIAVGLEQAGRSLNWAPAIAIGASSYSLYLSHPFVTQVIYTVSHRHINSPFTAFVAVLLSLVLAVLVGHLLHVSLELPLSRATRRIFHSKRLGVNARTLA